MTSDATKIRRRPVDITATIVVLIGHAVLAFYTYLFVGLAGVMGTDSCAYQECGDEKWLDIGLATMLGGGVILVLADLVVATLRMSAGKLAWFVPVLFCVGQVALAAVGLGLFSLAGPV